MTPEMKSVPLTQTPTVTLEWPEGDVFALSDETTTVYDLKLSNGDAQSLAVNVSSTIAGCLLRPTRFLVPGKSQTYLTIVFPPISSSPTDGATLSRTDTLSLETLLLPPEAMVDLNDLFDTSSNRKHFKKTVLHLSYRASSEEKSLDLLARYSNYRLSTKLQFNYTSPGYTTAYIMLKNHYKGEDRPPPGDCSAWRLSARYPFWFSVRNHPQAGHLLAEGDQAAFGFLPNGETHFTYIDFKGLGTFFGTELLDGFEASFMLEIFPLEKDPRLANGQIPEKQAGEIRKAAKVPFGEKQVNVIKQTLSLRKDKVTQEKRLQPLTPRFTFVFSGPSNQPQSASLTLTNEDKTNILVYRLQAQEPSFFKLLGTFLQPKATFGTFLALKPKQSEPLTVELNPGAKLNHNHLFRLDTFLLDWEAESEDDYWPAMMRSMDARQMETTFIPCIFTDEQAVVATSKVQIEAISGTPKDEQPKPGPLTLADNCDSRPDLNALQLGQIRKMSKEETDSACQKDIKPTVQRQITQVHGHPRPTALHAPKRIPESENKPSWTSHGTHPAPVPNSSALRNRTKDKKKDKKRVSPKPTLAAATQQTLAQRPTPEAASKPSTGSADKQMAIVDNKQSPTGSPTVPPSPGSTVKSPSGAANSAQPSPETPPSKPAIITVRTASNAPSTSVLGSILPQTISSVCRQRNAPSQAKKKNEKQKDSKKKENEKKTVSPIHTFAPKPGFPGAAKPRTAKSKLLAPSKATRHPYRRSPPLRAPFAPVGHPLPQDMVALLQIIVSLAIYLILLNALITALE